MVATAAAGADDVAMLVDGGARDEGRQGERSMHITIQHGCHSHAGALGRAAAGAGLGLLEGTVVAELRAGVLDVGGTSGAPRATPLEHTRALCAATRALFGVGMRCCNGIYLSSASTSITTSFTSSTGY